MQCICGVTGHPHPKQFEPKAHNLTPISCKSLTTSSILRAWRNSEVLHLGGADGRCMCASKRGRRLSPGLVAMLEIIMDLKQWR